MFLRRMVNSRPLLYGAKKSKLLLKSIGGLAQPLNSELCTESMTAKEISSRVSLQERMHLPTGQCATVGIGTLLNLTTATMEDYTDEELERILFGEWKEGGDELPF